MSNHSSPPHSPEMHVETSKTVKRRTRPPSVVVETLGATTSETKEGFRKINNYLLKKEIGRGAFGTVHLGIDENTNTEYAIKEFSKSRLRKKEQMEMFVRGGPRGRARGRMMGLGVNRQSGGATSSNPLDLVRGEMAILKKLNHPHVVRLFEVLDDPSDDSLYMVFEMMHRGTVINVEIDSVANPLAMDEARKYFRQMILGIEYLHANGIVHRDIKPDNLLISKEGVLKIVDFGVSEIFVKGNDKLKKSAGSPAFMAPELCVAKHGEVSGRAADIWSMGVTLYCMIHGKTPFITTNLLELYDMIKEKEIEYADHLSPDLYDLFHRILDRNSITRITMPELRNHPWVTHNDTEPMISEEDNCDIVSEVTEEEIRNAIKSIGSIFAVMKAVTKFKRHSRSLSQQSISKMMEQVKQSEKDQELSQSMDRLSL
ncbi:kinase-like domain-containing protein [Pilobolus umbonatus]|nr:kinase-like domain-containing protein [Pilobolus umbonatus]